MKAIWTIPGLLMIGHAAQAHVSASEGMAHAAEHLRPMLLLVPAMLGLGEGLRRGWLRARDRR